LADANLHIVPPIPTFFKGKEALQTGGGDRGMQVIDVRDLDFEIDTAAEWFDQLGPRPKAAVMMRLLQHQLPALPFEESESLLRARIEDAEAKENEIELETMFQVGAYQLWHKAGAHEFQSTTFSCNIDSKEAPMG
jgi:hypothetical protein